jgi:transposase-like protein
MKFKSLIHLLDYFKKEETCIKYAEDLIWNGRPQCPHCKSFKPYKTPVGYKCSNSNCYKKFTVKVGSIFEGSKLPFRTWFAAIYLVSSHKKGISSVQLSVDLNVTQKTAWFMLHRIREMFKNEVPESFAGTGIYEADETHVGGIEDNRHKNKKRYKDTDLANDGTPYNKKKVVIGIVERGGKIMLKVVKGTKTEDLLPVVTKYVPKGSSVITDESNSYFKLQQTHIHQTVNHSGRVFVDGNTHTNTIENFFSLLKRGIIGTYYQVSEKHLERYLNEFAARYNTRNVNAYERFENLIGKSKGGIQYKSLIAKG